MLKSSNIQQIKKLETLLKASFALEGAAMQPAVTAIGVCQGLKGLVKHLVKYSKRAEEGSAEDLPQTL